MGKPVDELTEWLARLEAAHPQTIELGLERVAAVGEALDLLRPSARVVMVAGTNGKGSVAATVAALGAAAGYRVALYTSPHLVRFNERVRIAECEASDAALCSALARVEVGRQALGVSLTYFEHTTLAAFDLFARSACDLWVLEVGLGGRLDAVNCLDADVSVITRIAYDHQDFLGNDLAQIAREKAGILRAERPAVIGDPQAPPALYQAAQALRAAPVLRAGVDFHYQAGGEGHGRDRWTWQWPAGAVNYTHLPLPAISGAAALSNAATALAAFHQLPHAERVQSRQIAAALRRVCLPGRLQQIDDGPLEWLLDVAHNADGATELASVIAASPVPLRTYAICAVAARKDAAAVMEAVAGCFDLWHLPQLDDPQLHEPEALAMQLRLRGETVASCGESLPELLAAVIRQACPGERIVVFGSFRIVAAVIQQQGWG